jgi:hypothetical protein
MTMMMMRAEGTDERVCRASDYFFSSSSFLSSCQHQSVFPMTDWENEFARDDCLWLQRLSSSTFCATVSHRVRDSPSFCSPLLTYALRSLGQERFYTARSVCVVDSAAAAGSCCCYLLSDVHERRATSVRQRLVSAGRK